MIFYDFKMRYNTAPPLQTWFKIYVLNNIEVSSAVFHPDSSTPFPLDLYLSFISHSSCFVSMEQLVRVPDDIKVHVVCLVSGSIPGHAYEKEISRSTKTQ